MLAIWTGHAAGACGADSSPATVIFGSDQDWPPYEFLDKKGQPSGFSVDLVRAVGEAVGLEIEVQLAPWHEIRQRLEVEETVDISDMFYSVDRERLVDFADPFSIVHDVIYTRPGLELSSREDLAGRRVLVQRGSYAHDSLGWNEVGAIAVLAASEPEALHRLAAGEAAAALVTQTVGRYVVRRDGLVDRVSAGPALNPRPYGFVVRKGCDELRELLNQGLVRVRADGRYQAIDNKWFSFRDPSETWGRNLALGLGVVVLVAVITLAWIRSLRGQVAARTAELSAELVARRRSEELLRGETRRSDAILHTAMDGYLVGDQSGRIRDVNAAYVAMSGYSREELLEMSIGDLEVRLRPKEIESKIAQLIASGGGRFETVHRRKDGTALELEVSASVVELAEDRIVTTFVRDIGQRRELEEQLRHSQKMEALGRLAGGVSHDFNNLLTAINGYAELLLERREFDPLETEAIKAIHGAGERAAALTQQLLAFSRKQPALRVVLDLHEVISGLEGILRRMLGEAAQVVCRLSEEPAWVEMDRGQAEQVLVNLLLNARDAMPEGGIVELVTARFSATSSSTRPLLEPGEYVTLSVSDTGIGIPQEDLSRIFEPFFTTKPVGAGTGLGLATAYGIVQQSGGDITVESRLGAGSRFEVYLPLAAPPLGPPLSSPRRETGGGGETILVVEDEVAVRSLIRTVLERLGYQVLDAPGGQEALAEIERRGGAIDLLLTDVVMPGMSGIKLAIAVRDLYPEVEVLYMSGYADGVVKPVGAPGFTSEHLSKPFSSDELASRVRAVLDRAPA